MDADWNYSEVVWTHWDNEEMTKAVAIARAPDFIRENCPNVTEIRIIEEKAPRSKDEILGIFL